MSGAFSSRIKPSAPKSTLPPAEADDLYSTALEVLKGFDRPLSAVVVDRFDLPSTISAFVIVERAFPVLIGVNANLGHVARL